MSHHQFLVRKEDCGRLDHFLAQKFKGVFSRTLCRKFILSGCVALSQDPAYKLKSGDQITFTPPSCASNTTAEAMPLEKEEDTSCGELEVTYEDEHLLVVNKPAGMVVHPGAGRASGTLVQKLAQYTGCQFFFRGERAGIVHRLDKDTSGLLVVAKNDAALAHLAAQFAAHGRDGQLERRYLALIWGTLTPKNGTIACGIGRDRYDRKKMSTRHHPGKNVRASITHYSVRKILPSMESGKPPLISLVECRLETGRTHQIRVHMASMGHPIVGDRVYGQGYETKANTLPEWVDRKAITTLGRQALHAYYLSFIHPATGERLTFESGWDEALLPIVKSLKLL